MGRTGRDAFEGYDEPVNSDMEFEEALKLVMEPDPEDDESTEEV